MTEQDWESETLPIIFECLSERFLNQLNRLPLGVARRLNPLNRL